MISKLSFFFIIQQKIKKVCNTSVTNRANACYIFCFAAFIQKFACLNRLF